MGFDQYNLGQHLPCQGGNGVLLFFIFLALMAILRIGAEPVLLFW